MSNPIPSPSPPPPPPPPPLPPPTVPSHDPLPHLPPPPPQHLPNTSAPTLSQLVLQSAPSQSPSQSPPQSPAHSSSFSESPSKPPPEPSPPMQHESEQSRSTCCCLPISLRPAPHHLKEPATSVFFGPKILLILRLAATAILIAHLIFFSLRGDFSYRLYSTWNYAGLSLAFFLVLVTSLLHVIRDEPDLDAHPEQFSATQAEGMITDVERQPLGPAPLPDPKLARALTRIAVPLYFVFVTATLFATAVYWAAIHPTAPDSLSFSYPLIILKVFAPAVALFDFLLTFRMRFRFLYVLLYTLYNGIYVAALVIFDKLQGDPVYALFDPSVQSTTQFLIKTASIAASSLAAAFIMYALSYLPALSSCFTGKPRRPKSKRSHPTEPSDTSRTNASDTTSESSASKSPDQVRRKSSEDSDPLKLTRNEESHIRISRSSKKNDRLSLPITATATISPSTSANRFRSSSARFAKSRSSSSLGSHGTQGSFSRSNSENRSSWQQMEQPAPQVEDEYFAMPSALGETEKIKLNRPMPRTESGSSLPGILSRSGSSRMLRSESNRLPRANSRTLLVRSSSDRTNARKSFVRSNSAASMR